MLISYSAEEFTILKSLGIDNLADIAHYRLTSQGTKDLLEIFYRPSAANRHANSYRIGFERNQVIAADTAAIKKAAKNGGSDPSLLAAIKELNRLSKGIKSP